MTTRQQQEYIFNNQQYLVDASAALSAAFFASPVVLCVDRAIAEAVSGKAQMVPSFLGSLKALVTKPQAFFRQPAFKWVYLIYSSSYLAANWSKTGCNQYEVDDSVISWAATSVVNMSTCILKDYKFAQLFGTVSKPVPPKSLGIWASRDMLTMYSALSAPPVVAKELYAISAGSLSERQSTLIAQFFTPLIFQIVLTPIHRWGYFAYENNNYTNMQLITFLKSDYLKSVLLRMVRCIAPWSIGQSINTELRSSFKSQRPLQKHKSTFQLD